MAILNCDIWFVVTRDGRAMDISVAAPLTEDNLKAEAEQYVSDWIDRQKLVYGHEYSLDRIDTIFVNRDDGTFAEFDYVSLPKLEPMSDYDLAYWLADKIPALGDYARQASDVLRKQAEKLRELGEQNSRQIALVKNLQALLAELEMKAAEHREGRLSALEQLVKLEAEIKQRNEQENLPCCLRNQAL